MFFINIKRENGKKESYRIDGEDVQEVTFSTQCGCCGKEIEFDEDEFYNNEDVNSYHGSAWYCGGKCTDKAKAIRNGFKILKSRNWKR